MMVRSRRRCCLLLSLATISFLRADAFTMPLATSTSSTVKSSSVRHLASKKIITPPSYWGSVLGTTCSQRCLCPTDPSSGSSSSSSLFSSSSQQPVRRPNRRVKKLQAKPSRIAMPEQEVAAVTAPRRSRRLKSTRTLLEQQPQQLPGKKLEQVMQKNNMSTSKRKYITKEFTGRSMLQHEILTKDEELKLGRAIQRAKKFQQIFLKRKLSIVAYEEEYDDADDEQDENDGVWGWRESSDYYNGVYEDEDELIGNLSLSIYGIEQLEPAFEDYMVSDPAAYYSRKRTIPNDKNPRLKADDWNIHAMAMLFELCSKSNHNVDTEDASVFHYLDNDDTINALFELTGGRKELHAVLLEGAIARDALIRSNIRLVVAIAKKWAKHQHRPNQPSDGDLRGRGGAAYEGSWDRPSLAEAVQEGILGLAKAVDRFRPELDLKFSTYATLWIINSVRTCFRSHATPSLNIPTGYHDTRSHFLALIKQYHESFTPVPPLETLAKQMNMQPERLLFILQVTKPAVSIDRPLRLTEGSFGSKLDYSVPNDPFKYEHTLVDTEEVSPEFLVELSLLRQSLENAMASELVPHERDIVRLRLGLDDGVPRSVRQVAQEYGGALSNTQVRLAESRAYKKLRSPRALSTYKLLAFLDFCGIDKEDAFSLRS